MDLPPPDHRRRKLLLSNALPRLSVNDRNDLLKFTVDSHCCGTFGQRDRRRSRSSRGWKLPELPEVETMRRGILPVVGRRIESVDRTTCSLRPILLRPRIDAIDRRLKGRCITQVDRIGKRVVLVIDGKGIDGGQFLVIEPRMTGLVLLADPPDTTHLRLRIRLSPAPAPRSSQSESTGDQLLFWDRRGLGTVRLMDAEELDRAVRRRLGVDALQITAQQLQLRLGSSQRAIKVALLDQSAVAGIGNLYASEILFVAGVDPRTPCRSLTWPQWQRIHTATQRVLLEAIEHEGSTLSDGTYRNALNGEGGYQHFHRVYDRQGQACPRCHQGAIRRIVQAQRSTFFCPICQRKKGQHPSLRED
jgi:formamidopyrimidine-DNA glycosylase